MEIEEALFYKDGSCFVNTFHENGTILVTYLLLHVLIFILVKCNLK